MTSLEDSTHQEPGGHLTPLESPLQEVMVAEMPELEPAATDRSRHSACSTRTSQSRCTRRPRKYLALGCGIYIIYRVISGQLSSPVCVLVVYDEEGEASALVDGGELVGGGRVLGLAHHLGQHGHLQQSVGGSEVATKFPLKRRST